MSAKSPKKVGLSPVSKPQSGLFEISKICKKGLKRAIFGPNFCKNRLFDFLSPLTHFFSINYVRKKI